jgi:serine phosphatase RsbU (regulator of sigma subunit)
MIKQNTAKPMPGKGFPIGIMERATYSQESCQLDEPCQIALFSDGIYEVIEGDFEEKENKHLEIMKQQFNDIDKCVEHFDYLKLPERPDDISIMLFNFKG